MRKFILILLAIGFIHTLQAQKTITGTIQDEIGEVLPGATIIIKGTEHGSVADIDGKYSITVPNDEAILVFSFVGFDSKEVLVGAQSVVDVTLKVGEFIGCGPIYNYVIIPSYFSESLKNDNAHIADFLNQQHPIASQQTQTNGGAVLLQGRSAQKTSYYLDGIELNHAFLGSENSPYLLGFQSADISKAYAGFYTNSYLSLTSNKIPDRPFQAYGLLRYASARNEQTAYARASYKKNDWKGQTSIGFSQFGDWHSGKRKNDFNSYQWIQTSVTQLFNGRDILVNNNKPFTQRPNDYNHLSLSQKVEFKGKHLLQFHFNQFSALSQYGRLQENSAGQFSTSDLRYAEFGNDKQHQLLTSYQFKESISGFAFTSRIHFQQIEDSQISRRFGSQWRQQQSEQINSLGALFALERKYSNLEVGASIRLGYDVISSSASQFNINTDETQPIVARFADGSSFTKYALELTSSYDFGSSWKLDGFFELKGASTETINQLISSSQVQETRNLIAPNVGLKLSKEFNFLNWFRIENTLSSNTRIPNMYEMAGVGVLPASRYFLIPNADLQTEKSYNYSLMTHLDWNNFTLTNYVFHSWLKDWIQLRPTQFRGSDVIAVNGATYTSIAHANIAKARLYGFSSNLNFSFSDFSIDFGATYFKGKNSTEENNPLSSISPFSGLLSVTYEQSNPNISHSFSAQYNGGKPLDQFAIGSADNRNYFIETDGTPAWYTLNYSADWRISRQIQLKVAVENILDTHYRTFGSSLNATGRNLIVALAGTF